MNPRILWQIKSVCGVLGRDSMLVFDEGCIRSDLRMKVYEKGEKIPILGIFGRVYRYTLSLYQCTFGSGHFWPKCTGTH